MSVLLILLLSPLLLPAWAMGVLTLAALGRHPQTPWYTTDTPTQPTVAVLVPAHNESSHVLPTIANLKAQIQTQAQEKLGIALEPEIKFLGQF